MPSQRPRRRFFAGDMTAVVVVATVAVVAIGASTALLAAARGSDTPNGDEVIMSLRLHALGLNQQVPVSRKLLAVADAHRSPR